MSTLQRLSPLVTGTVLALVLGAAPAGAADRVLVPVSAGAGTSAGFVGATPDGERVFFATSESLTSDDVDDGVVDVYERRGATLRLATGPGDGAGDGADHANIQALAVTPDGGLLYKTDAAMNGDDVEPFVPAEDLFLATADGVRLVTKKVSGGFGGPFLPQIEPLVRVSEDGSAIAFATDDRLLPADLDNTVDAYVDRDGVLERLESSSAPSFPAALSADGRSVAITTSGALDASDTDGLDDVYVARDGTTTLATPGTAGGWRFGALSADGAHVVFETPEALVPADTDGGAQDVYDFSDGAVRLASTGPTDPHGDVTSGFQDVSADGDRIAFTTVASLVAADADADAEDIYLRDDGTTTILGSTGPNPRGRDSFFFFGDLSPSGDLFWTFGEDLVDEDTDGFWKDAYRRTDSATTLLSVSENDQNADASFAGFAPDGSRTFFQTDGRFTTDDADAYDDLYERTEAGDTQLLTGGAEPCSLVPSYRCAPVWKRTSTDGARVLFESDEPLVAGDVGEATDVYESRVVDPPTVGGTDGTLTVTEEGGATPVVPDITVADPYDDVQGAIVRVEAGAGTDELGLDPVPDGLSLATEDDGATLRLTGRAPAQAYADALRAVTYRNRSDNPVASRDVVVVVEGTGTSTPARRTVAVTPVNDPPRVAVGASTPATFTEREAAVRIADALTVVDPDDTTAAGATLTITDGYLPGADLLAAGDLPGGVTATRTGATLRLSGTAEVAAYVDALRAVTLRVAGDDPGATPRTVRIVVDDAEGPGTAETVTVAVVPVNDPPRVGLAPGILDLAPGTAGPLDATLEVDDPDDTSLSGATVAITAGLDPGDVLATGPVDPAITTFLTGGTVELSGRAPVAAYRAALRTVTLRAGGPAGTTRTVQVRAADSDGPGPAAVREVRVITAPGPSPAPAAPAPAAAADTPSTPGPVGASGPARRLVLSLGPSPRPRGSALLVGCSAPAMTMTACSIQLTLPRRGRSPLYLGRARRTTSRPAGSLAVRVRLGPIAQRRLRVAGRRPMVRLSATATTPEGRLVVVRRARVLRPR